MMDLFRTLGFANRFARGLLRWWKCELINLGLMLRRRADDVSNYTATTQWLQPTSCNRMHA